MCHKNLSYFFFFFLRFGSTNSFKLSKTSNAKRVKPLTMSALDFQALLRAELEAQLEKENSSNVPNQNFTKSSKMTVKTGKFPIQSFSSSFTLDPLLPPPSPSIFTSSNFVHYKPNSLSSKDEENILFELQTPFAKQYTQQLKTRSLLCFRKTSKPLTLPQPLVIYSLSFYLLCERTSYTLSLSCEGVSLSLSSYSLILSLSLARSVASLPPSHLLYSLSLLLGRSLRSLPRTHSLASLVRSLAVSPK